MTMGRNVPPRIAPVSAPPEAIAPVAVLPMTSERKPPSGCKMTMAMAPETRNVTSGVTNRDSVSGTQRRNRFSMQQARIATSSTEMMPPRPGTSVRPASWTFARPGCARSAPRIAPSTGVPPNSSIALRPTRMFSPQKTVEPAMASSW